MGIKSEGDLAEVGREDFVCNRHGLERQLTIMRSLEDVCGDKMVSIRDLISDAQQQI